MDIFISLAVQNVGSSIKFRLESKYLPNIGGEILGLVLGGAILPKLLLPLQKDISRILKISFLESRGFKLSNDV